MTTGLGFSIGSVNSVSAAVAGARSRPSIRTRRTALTYDEGVGDVHRFHVGGVEFADLSRDPVSIEVGGRIYSPPNLVAAVARGLVDACDPAAGAVVTYPAVYPDKQVALLRQAFDLSGSRDVLLVPEPVAAAEWLEFEQGPLESGFVLVYDLGATSLDITVVRVGPEWTDHPVIGKPLRSHEFGGRPLGSVIARHARAVAPDGRPSSLPARDIEDLRVAHIRKSFGLVRAGVRASGRGFADIGHILVIGGAARAPEVAETLTELGRPVVMSADPGQCCAAGAAHFAARVFAPADTETHAPRVAVFSSAAVASALAMSAVTVFGGAMERGLSPILEIMPGTGTLTDNALYDPSGDTPLDSLVRRGVPAALDRIAAMALPLCTGYTELASTMTAPMGPTVAESLGTPHSRHTVRNAMLYADPTLFTNPLPFNLPTPKPKPGREDPEKIQSTEDHPSEHGRPSQPGASQPTDNTPTKDSQPSGTVADDIAQSGAPASDRDTPHGKSSTSKGGGPTTDTDPGTSATTNTPTSDHDPDSTSSPGTSSSSGSSSPSNETSSGTSTPDSTGTTAPTGGSPGGPPSGGTTHHTPSGGQPSHGGATSNPGTGGAGAGGAGAGGSLGGGAKPGGARPGGGLGGMGGGGMGGGLGGGLGGGAHGK